MKIIKTPNENYEIMKIFEFYLRIKKIMKILEFDSRINRIMKIVTSYVGIYNLLNS